MCWRCRKGGGNKKCVQVTGQHWAYLGTQQWFLKAGVQLIHEGWSSVFHGEIESTEADHSGPCQDWQATKPPNNTSQMCLAWALGL